MQQGAMPALCLIPELRGPAQVLRYGGGHAADDLSDNLESRKVTDRQRRWVIARGGESQGNGRHVQPPLKVTRTIQGGEVVVRYFSSDHVTVLVDKMLLRHRLDRNVFSLFSLEEDVFKKGTHQ